MQHNPSAAGGDGGSAAVPNGIGKLAALTQRVSELEQQLANHSSHATASNASLLLAAIELVERVDKQSKLLTACASKLCGLDPAFNDTLRQLAEGREPDCECDVCRQKRAAGKRPGKPGGPAGAFLDMLGAAGIKPNVYELTPAESEQLSDAVKRGPSAIGELLGRIMLDRLANGDKGVGKPLDGGSPEGGTDRETDEDREGFFDGIA